MTRKILASCVALSLSAFVANAAACGEEKDGEKKKNESVTSLCGEDKDGHKKNESVTSLCGEEKDGEKKKNES